MQRRMMLATTALLALAVWLVGPASAAWFYDGFENGVLGSLWEVVPGTYNQILFGDNAHAIGNQSARQEAGDPWVYYMRTTSTAFPSPGLIAPGMQEILTCWIWDDNVQSGAQTAAGLMLANNALSDFFQLQVNSTGSWTHYRWRTSQDGTFTSSIPRTQGWHKWQIVVNPYTGNTGDVLFYIDDQPAGSGKRKGDFVLDQIRLGISIKTPGSPFWYDDVTLEITPEPGSLLALGAGFVGLAGCVLRRRS